MEGLIEIALKWASVCPLPICGFRGTVMTVGNLPRRTYPG